MPCFRNVEHDEAMFGTSHRKCDWFSCLCKCCQCGVPFAITQLHYMFTKCVIVCNQLCISITRLFQAVLSLCYCCCFRLLDCFKRLNLGLLLLHYGLHSHCNIACTCMGVLPCMSLHFSALHRLALHSHCTALPRLHWLALHCLASALLYTALLCISMQCREIALLPALHMRYDGHCML